MTTPAAMDDMRDPEVASAMRAEESLRERRVQSQQVMPMIGPLIDQWSGMSNDSKSTLRWEHPTLCQYLDKIEAAVSRP